MAPKYFIPASILLFLTSGFLLVSGAFAQPNPKIDPETMQMIMTGAESVENIELIEQIKKDLKIENVSVKVIMGPFDAQGLTGQLVTLPDGYVILINSNLYEELTGDERKALISHEMGHVLYVPRIHLYDLNRTGLDICADFFGVKYAGVDAVLSLLEKLYSIPEDYRDQPDYKIRKAALEEVKRN